LIDAAAKLSNPAIQERTDEETPMRRRPAPTRASTKRVTRWLVVAASLLATPVTAADFYAGKTITIISGGSGGYDAYARLLARHMGRHIPGDPTMIVKNMPGAASMNATNSIYNVTAADGLTLGGFLRSIPLAPLLGDKSAKYDPLKFTWIGSSSTYLDDAYLFFVRKTLGVRTVADLKGRTEPVRLGSTGKASQTDEGARVIADALGYNFQIIRGYPGTPSIVKAIEAGEMDGTMIGISSLSSIKPDWLKPDSDVQFLLQFGYGGEGRNPQVADVPRIDELASRELEKGMFLLLQLPFKLARPFAGPPNMPAERTAILRDAFMRTQKDPHYLAEAEKMHVDISPITGTEVAEIIAKAQSLPPALIQRYTELVN
jgi:tripartite-type tricarboxylate transporter receptor subunit TctC